MAVYRSYLRLIVQFLTLLFLSDISESIRYGEPSRTLHISHVSRRNAEGPTHVEVPQDLNSHVHPKFSNDRQKRSMRNSEFPSFNSLLNTSGMITTFSLNSSKERLTVHWAGKGSTVIVCLARDRNQTETGSSEVYFSYDYGEVFVEKQKYMRVANNKSSVISAFYISQVLHTHFIFTDVIHNYLFTTRDVGHSFQAIPLKFKPDQIAMHPTNVEVLLAMDKSDPEKRLWLSEDFGVSWREIQRKVKSFFWGEVGIDPENTLFVERIHFDKTSIILSSTNFFKNEDDIKVLISSVEDFEVKEKYILASKKQHLLGSKNPNSTLQLWVSYNRTDFQRAIFSTHLEHTDYFIKELSEDQIFICVMHGSYSNLYVSDVQGRRFSLSLENILYLKSDDSNDAVLDLHGVQGVRGVYIATKVNTQSTKSAGLEDLVSVITFDKGGTWQPITPPKYHKNGSLVNCSLDDDCSLHLTQKFSLLYSRGGVPMILSKESAVGLVIASGVIGKSLKGKPSLYISNDAGLTWHEVMYGSYLYTFGDFGGVIVATEYYYKGEETDEILYSVDMGETWTSLQFSKNEKIRVYGLMTEPGEKTTVFTLFGSKIDHHEWLIVKVDLRSTLKYTCGPDDYKWWSFHGLDSSCLLGRKEMFKRRIPHSNCYNGQDYVRSFVVRNCPCTRDDYECDVGFKDNKNLTCVKDPDSDDVDVYKVPSYCRPGLLYNRTKGYRKVPGDTCEKGDAFKFDPEVISCPSKDDLEFLLVAQKTKVTRIPLTDPNSSDWETLPLPNLQNVITIDYNYRNNCIFWGDSESHKIMMQCLDHEGVPEVLVQNNLGTVEGLAFDWISRNLYFVDGENSKVEVICTGCQNKHRRTIINSTKMEKPRGIALHPLRGYLYLTDWNERNPFISRAHMDGTGFTVLFGSSVVQYPNGITIDFMSDRLFWVDAKLDYVASSDLEGKDFKYVINDKSVVVHPFSIAVYKDWIYFDDISANKIMMANKHDGRGARVLSSNVTTPLDLKVYSLGTQQGHNGCSNHTCTHLCFAYPNGQHKCLCPDGWMVQKIPETGEKCLCAEGEIMQPDGICKTADSTCSSYQFMCANNQCIPKMWKCDGENDCGDRSDETNCTQITCQTSQFTCKNGNCIPLNWKCDYDRDCSDGSDEEGCIYPPCSADEFLCANGRCIKKAYRCDFDNDCRDGSDEVNCTSTPSHCRSTEFKCKSADQCLPVSWHCDGDRDCNDGSDEADCKSKTCEPWQHHCNNGRCIFNTWVCDGEDDCGDNSDEESCNNTSIATATSTTPSHTEEPSKCTPWMFTCGDSTCIPFWWKCDGVTDCSDGADEALCADIETHASSTTSTTVQPPTSVADACGPDQFRCSSGKCIWNSWVCDKTKDCSEGDDELYCPESTACNAGYFRCVHSTGCVPPKDVCNGRNDCGDGSDEWGCTSKNIIIDVKCRPAEFNCLSGECIPLYERCDFNIDCSDGSDEDNCTSRSTNTVKDLLVDEESINQTSFKIFWQPPLKNQTYSYLPSISERHGKGWRNESWINESTYSFHNLMPGTDYQAGVYVRIDSERHVFKPNRFVAVTTLAAGTAEPVNVEVKQINKLIQVSWQKSPSNTVEVTGYKVYFTPPSPPVSTLVTNAATSVNVSFAFKPGINYIFWVKALSGLQESPNSGKANITYAKDAAFTEVPNLVVKEVTNTSVYIKWDALKEKVDGYRVMFRLNEQNYEFEWDEINTTETSKNLTQLAPDSNYTIKVFAFKDEFVGPETGIDVHVKGKILPAPKNITASVDGSRITLKWLPVLDERSAKWTYGIYSLNSSKVPTLLAKTSNTSYTLTTLESCEVYPLEVRLVKPFSIGPSEFPHVVVTEFDKQAPPKNVHIETVPGNKTAMLVKWNSSCIMLEEPIGYKVMVREIHLGIEKTYTVKATNKTSLSQVIRVHLGGAYSVQVQTSEPYSRLSHAKTFWASSLPVPQQLNVIPELNGSLYMHWKEIDPPTELKDHKFVYIIRIGHDERLEHPQKYNVSKPPFTLPSVDEGVIYYVAVSLLDEHGFESALSNKVPVGGLAAKPLVITTSNLVGVIIGVLLVIGILSGVLGFIIVRHRRLQRSFMSFANTHYDTRSGATTFTTTGDELDEEDDSPVIRGFSDDEPLVIA